MSSKFTQFAEGWLNYTRAVAAPETLPEEIKQKAGSRSEICRACPEFQSLSSDGAKGPLQGRCKKCGCIFPAMVYSIGKKCPLNKW